ncbi:MAG TPA: type II toxin-antitoxin system HicB family antitoxin [Thermoanaerobaculia bacterium]|nr:type II toxin-antitoxin system HicB family antitoxin [Thermoanaerobaculia bacterium]
MSLVTQHRYTVILERENDGGFHAFVPALRGCHTQGDTVDEALANAQEAIAAYLESMVAHGESIPTEELLIRPVEVGV